MSISHGWRDPGNEPATTVENGGFSPVPADALDATVRALRQARLADSSTVAYRRDVRCWQAFMSTQDKSAWPVLGPDVAVYVAHLLTTGSAAVPVPRPLAPSTIERRLAALGTWCREQGQPRPDLAEAREVLHGHQHLHGRPAAARAAPLTVSALRDLLSQIEVDAQAGRLARAARNRALLLLAFAVGARRSEAVAIDIADVTITTEGMLVTITRAKTRRTPDIVAVPWADDVTLCPVRAVHALRQLLSDQGVVHGPLFRRVTATDHVLVYRLRPAAVAQIIHGLAEEAGLMVPDGYRSFSGHSVRRGMATESRRAGADGVAIARQGGWVDGSQSLNVYLADVDRWQRHPLRGVL